MSMPPSASFKHSRRISSAPWPLPTASFHCNCGTDSCPSQEHVEHVVFVTHQPKYLSLQGRPWSLRLELLPTSPARLQGSGIQIPQNTRFVGKQRRRCMVRWSITGPLLMQPFFSSQRCTELFPQHLQVPFLLWNVELQEVTDELVTTLKELPGQKRSGVFDNIKSRLDINNAQLTKRTLTSQTHEWL
jgi:hypothetical protein